MNTKEELERYENEMQNSVKRGDIWSFEHDCSHWMEISIHVIRGRVEVWAIPEISVWSPVFERLMDELHVTANDFDWSESAHDAEQAWRDIECFGDTNRYLRIGDMIHVLFKTLRDRNNRSA